MPGAFDASAEANTLIVRVYDVHWEATAEDHGRLDAAILDELASQERAG